MVKRLQEVQKNLERTTETIIYFEGDDSIKKAGQKLLRWVKNEKMLVELTKGRLMRKYGWQKKVVEKGFVEIG